MREKMNENNLNLNLNLDLNLGLDDDNELKNKKTSKSGCLPPRTKVGCFVRKQKNIYRRAFSETNLLDAVGSNFKDGESYHCLTGGDVDALSYLKVILRQQDLDYCMFSTWCMASDDVLQIEEWITDGKIKKLDVFVGEIFKGSYSTEFDHLKELATKTGGRIAVFRNHSKTFAGYGEKFHFAVETSANINTNPRVENGCITIGKDIFDFYHDFYDKIVSFDKDSR